MIFGHDYETRCTWNGKVELVDLLTKYKKQYTMLSFGSIPLQNLTFHINPLDLFSFTIMMKVTICGVILAQTQNNDHVYLSANVYTCFLSITNILELGIKSSLNTRFEVPGSPDQKRDSKILNLRGDYIFIKAEQNHNALIMVMKFHSFHDFQ
jgi:hypothetical protein